MSSEVTSSAATVIDERNFGSFRKILLLSGPLILSHMGVMFMQIVDGLFLSRYSTDAIAALGPAGMTFWLLCGFFIGMAGYTNTFVAQYVGAGRPHQVGAAVWQGIYIAVCAGAILAGASLGAAWFFDMVGHSAGIRAYEITYFRIMCYGGLATVLSAALSGFFAGRNDNLMLMTAHLSGNIVNAVLAWALVFGHLGLPGLGMAGAALATVTGQICQVVILMAAMLRPRFVREYRTWQDRAIRPALLWRMCAYGAPNGLRYILEIMAWDVFMLLMGRVDSRGLSATNIVFRINGVAFFPVVGLATAVSMLVGQAQGARRPDLSRKVTWRGLLLGEIWMAASAAAMVLMPQILLDPFFSADAAQAELEVRSLCVTLLWFVAAYCLADGVNIVFMSMLQGVGDTRWLLYVSGGIHVVFLLILIGLVWAGAGVYSLWTAATAFICCLTVAWLFRFRSTRWEDKQVIEHPPIEVSDAPMASAPL